MSRPVSRPRADRLHATPFVPWAGQRLARRSDAETRVVVAARQVGKSTWSAHEVLRIALAKPGSTSMVIAPITTPFLLNAIERISAAAKRLPCAVDWKHNESRFVLGNGSTIACLSGESAKGEVGRGFTINGSLWIDEAALLKEGVYTAALGALTVGNGRVLLTTTPVGKNWIHREFTSKDKKNARFRFRATDSPYMNHERLRTLRAKVSPERAAADFDAMFVDSLLLAFPDTSRLFVSRFPDRSAERVSALRYVLGVDLAYERDFTVVTLMNCYGEARVLLRCQHRNYMDVVDELADLARQHEALVVLDLGPGGGPGLPLQHRLERDFGVRVLPVHTAVQETKTAIVEQLRGDVRWEKVHVLEDPHDEEGKTLAAQLRHELSVFQGVLHMSRGKARRVYEAPALEGEHDDCVISLCLANWGRIHLEGGPSDADEPDVDPQDLLDLNRRLGERLSRPDAGGAWFDLGGGNWINPFRGPPPNPGYFF